MQLFEWISKQLNYQNIIGANDIIGWVLAFVGGLIVYKIVDGFQTRISRHSMILEIESRVNEMLSSDFAMNIYGETKNKRNMRTILDDNDRWLMMPTEEEKRKLRILIVDNQRYVEIRKREEDGSIDYISTRAIHEYVILFRRIEKLYKDGIIKKVDLSDLWREILPFGTSGRPELFSSYLTKEDLDSMHYVIAITISCCKKYNKKFAIKYINDNFTDDIIENYLDWNSRFRKRDWYDYQTSRRVKED